MFKLNNNWDILLSSMHKSKYFNDLSKLLDTEYLNNIIYPNKNDIFKALKITDYEDVKVLFLGQDPYHGTSQANGLSFSVNDQIKLPPSLKNIYKELNNDLGIKKHNGDLTNWALQGVLLLNSILTVIKDNPASHHYLNWEYFTDEIIKILNNKEKPVVFILMGEYAKQKENLITNDIHLIIKTTHPSPFSAYKGFFGSNIFSKTNKFLKDNNIKEIKW